MNSKLDFYLRFDAVFRLNMTMAVYCALNRRIPNFLLALLVVQTGYVAIEKQIGFGVGCRVSNDTRIKQRTLQSLFLGNMTLKRADERGRERETERVTD